MSQDGYYLQLSQLDAAQVIAPAKHTATLDEFAPYFAWGILQIRLQSILMKLPDSWYLLFVRLFTKIVKMKEFPPIPAKYKGTLLYLQDVLASLDSYAKKENFAEELFTTLTMFEETDQGAQNFYEGVICLAEEVEKNVPTKSASTVHSVVIFFLIVFHIFYN